MQQRGAKDRIGLMSGLIVRCCYFTPVVVADTSQDEGKLKLQLQLQEVAYAIRRFTVVKVPTGWNESSKWYGCHIPNPRPN